MKQLEYHRALLSDEATQQAFRAALTATLHGGETVLDLGTGTGIHALFACQAGAKRVYAVDRHDFIELARRICQVNGYGDRVAFLHTPAEQLALPEQVDLIVTHQELPHLFALLPSARDRFLKPGGVLIPQAIDLHCAPIEVPDAYHALLGFWEEQHYGFSLAPAHTVALNALHELRIEPAALLGDPVQLASYELSQVTNPVLCQTVNLNITRSGILHGVGIWLVEWLTKEIALASDPTSAPPKRVWPHEFFPIARPEPVAAGETVSVRIQTGTGGWAKFWVWEVTIADRHGAQRERFAHSTFAGTLFSKETLRKQAPDYRPTVTTRGVAVRFILDHCNGSSSLQSIQANVTQQFPDLFRSEAEAAEFVAAVTAQYSL